MTQSVIYSKPHCPYCDQAKDLLNKTQIEYEEIVIGKDITVEKLFEELLLSGDTVQATKSDQIFIEKPVPVIADQISNMLDTLKNITEHYDRQKLIQALQVMIPTYTPEDEIKQRAQST